MKFLHFTNLIACLLAKEALSSNHEVSFSQSVNVADTTSSTLTFTFDNVPYSEGDVDINFEYKGDIGGDQPGENIDISSQDACSQSSSLGSVPCLEAMHAVMESSEHYAQDSICVILKANAEIKCWGSNTPGIDSNVPVAPGGQDAFTGTPIQIMSGLFNHCTVLDDHTVWCIGKNEEGEIGDGGPTSSFRRVQINGQYLTNVEKVWNAYKHSCVKHLDGSLTCFGSNAVGWGGSEINGGRVIGVNAVYDGTTPATKAKKVLLAAVMTCVLGEDDYMQCFGGNSHSSLGYFDTRRYLPGVVEMQGQEIGACYLLETGKVYCWGYNAHGQLGNGNTSNQVQPVEVLGVSNVANIGLAAWSGCVAFKDGSTPKCWGNSWSSHTFGGATPTDYVAYNHLSGSIKRVFNYQPGESLALLDNGEIYSTGLNLAGELGRGVPSSFAAIGANSARQITFCDSDTCSIVGNEQCIVGGKTGDATDCPCGSWDCPSRRILQASNTCADTKTFTRTIEQDVFNSLVDANGQVVLEMTLDSGATVPSGTYSGTVSFSVDPASTAVVIPSCAPSLQPSEFPSLLSSDSPSNVPSISSVPTHSPIRSPVAPDPCRKNKCSGHGKCFVHNNVPVCICEDTFIQNEKKDDCFCPEGTLLNAEINRCYSITESPTKSPITAPTTSTPTATPTEFFVIDDPSCSDSTLPMKIEINGAKKLKKCEWVARRNIQERCSIPTVALHCPSTCKSYGGDCDIDSSARIKIAKDDGEDVLRYCTWVGANPNERCGYEGVASACRASCGLL